MGFHINYSQYIGKFVRAIFIRYIKFKGLLYKTIYNLYLHIYEHLYLVGITNIEILIFMHESLLLFSVLIQKFLSRH